MLFIRSLVFIISLSLIGCASFKGPGELKAPGYQVNAPIAPASEGISNPKKAKIENDLDHPQPEGVDDQSEQNVFEHLAPQGEHAPGTDTAKEMHFDWPVDEAKLSRGFLERKRRPHWGLDLANKKGTPILSAENGYVVYTGKQFHGYGRLIVIEHNDQWATLYAHLDKFLVKEGEFVKRGQAIGQMGRSGHATGSHLHFELRDNRRPVDPLQFLPAHE